MGKGVVVDLVDQSKSDPAGFLKTVLAGLRYDDFQFSDKGGDGALGGFCISRAMPIFLRKKDADKGWNVKPHSTIPILAAHLNFGISIGQYLGPAHDLTVKLRLVHVTVRRMKSQLQIDENGPSKATAAEAIHSNRNTQWNGRKANLDKLAEQINTLDGGDFTGAQIVEYLTEYEGWGDRYMAQMEAGLPLAIKQQMMQYLRCKDILFDVDASLSGRGD